MLVAMASLGFFSVPAFFGTVGMPVAVAFLMAMPILFGVAGLGAAARWGNGAHIRVLIRQQHEGCRTGKSERNQKDNR